MDWIAFHLILHTGNVTLPEFRWNGDHYLYTTKCNYVDLNADENGLWAIYSTPKTTNTYVVKVNECKYRIHGQKTCKYDLFYHRLHTHTNTSEYFYTLKQKQSGKNLIQNSRFSFYSPNHSLRSISLMQSLWKFSTVGILA